MNRPWRIFRSLAMLMCVGGGAALLGGCKGNTTSAANSEHGIMPPPAVVAHHAGADLREANPLVSPVWRDAQWLHLVGPMNTVRTTAASRMAMLYDAETLYVAFVNENQGGSGDKRDAVSLMLDTTAAGNGTEMVQVQVESSGAKSCAWIRSATPATPHADGSPDLLHPVSKMPGFPVELWCKTGEGVSDGVPVWTVVVGIPLNQLPRPLAVTSATAGARWKVNALRTVVKGTGDHVELLQANLSPVYVGSQDVSAYRMSELVLGK